MNGLRHEGKQPSRVLNLWSYESQHVLIVLGENKSVSSDESSNETKQLVLELKRERVIRELLKTNLNKLRRVV